MGVVNVKCDNRRNELLSDIASASTSILEGLGVVSELANQAGDEIADFIADSFGGQVISFPKDCRYRMRKRNEQIFEEFTGDNHDELAQQFNMTTRAIYKVLQKQRLLKKSQREAQKC